MVKESARKCSHCGNNGHNSRTCKGCFKLFGVKIFPEDDMNSIRKVKSLVNLRSCNADNGTAEMGYLSDGIMHQGSREGHERRKGKPWSEDEHRSFLLGLEKLGKGDWRGISKNYVPSRTPAQVASHAQKYFIRRSASERKRRRISVFDISINEASSSQVSPGSPSKVPEHLQQASSLNTTLKNSGECREKAGNHASHAGHERPPLSPMGRGRVFSDFCCVPNMGFPGTSLMPTVSWLHVPSFPYHHMAYMPEMFPTCTPFIPPPPRSTLQEPVHPSSSQAQQTSPITSNNVLNLAIGKLKL